MNELKARVKLVRSITHIIDGVADGPQLVERAFKYKADLKKLKLSSELNRV